ncbi:hypothetical protein FRB94_004137 [Tulasnella sp. JGI-2019a]|nr:hypothetical protein FRB94_004137 [Tulasnella sp. JGI-2019a]KAG9016830.1 hypothetical protein FRB93_009359 [Tulasnella sp. JGI-2019a]KAG9040273.1 hypothetical protein FRB95_000203 [Tulasnella sp. JGI-2019a]
MDSVIEIQRQTHEEIERLDRAAATLLSQAPATRRQQIKDEHKVSNILDRITSRASTLHSSYIDEDNSRHTETTLLSEPGLTEFYSRLKRVKDYHMKYPEQPSDPFELELGGLLGEEEDLYDAEDNEDPVALLFSGEESFGRYLDLYAHHSQYNNFKTLPRHVSYVQYLDALSKIREEKTLHQELSSTIKLTKEYESYVTSLYAYLLSFTKRTQPLVDVDTQQREAETEFEKLWSQGQITGWGDAPLPEANGADGGVYCTACQKHYAKQTVYDAHLKSKKHLKAVSRDTAQDGATKPHDPSANGANTTSTHSTNHAPHHSKHYKSALTSHLIVPVLLPLLPTLLDSKSNVERRFALTARERELESESTEQQSSVPAHNPNGTATKDGEDEDEEERIYNPLKLPLGWDGKPIPYWLYKLHGLGVEYRCEICSDGVYMGRKNFERHFQESRHAFGMRALGLPNTKHFHEITRIEDALALAEKLKQEGRQEIFQNETMEEMEDDEGNVYNKKTYEDLKKQGIIS